MKADTVYPGAFKGETGKFWALIPWVSRFFLLAPALIFTMVAFRFIADPGHAAARNGVNLSTPEAITDTRVAASFILTIVVALIYSLIAQSRLRLGHALVIVSVGLALALRAFGFMHDGTTLAMGDQMRKAGGEVAVLILNSLGMVLQTVRSRG